MREIRDQFFINKKIKGEIVLIPDEESLEFLIEHLKYMIQEQPDRKVEKISDLTDVLSDFMSTFLVVVDSLISTSQRRFRAIDEKLGEFEDLLLSSSVKGISELSELSQATEKRPLTEMEIKEQEILSKVTKTPGIPSKEVVTPPPPPPTPSVLDPTVTPTMEAVPSAQPNEVSKEIPMEISEDMEVEDLAAFAFQERKKVTAPTPRPTSTRLGAVSLKMELMQELKKKFGADKKEQNEPQ